MRWVCIFSGAAPSIIASLPIVLVGCSPFQSTKSAADKAALTRNIFQDPVITSQASNMGQFKENPFSPAPPSSPQAAQGIPSLSVLRVCHHDGLMAAGGSVKSATATWAPNGAQPPPPPLKISLLSTTGTVACAFDGESARVPLATKAQLPIDLNKYCPNLAPGDYLVAIYAGTSENLLNYDSARAIESARQVTVVKTNQGLLDLKLVNPGEKPALLYDNYPSITPNECDFSVLYSPLLVQLSTPKSQAHQLSLTAPWAGILFDISGLNAKPIAHAKEAISWFTSESISGNFFLVLPNGFGAVNGIDEMFGNNTYGPDQSFALNGFEALRKWDGRTAGGGYDPFGKDGRIDRRDEIFVRLRLWSDRNLNGIAESNELYRLPDQGISSVSLDYDRSYWEIDRYGNTIKYKSIVQMSDGSRNVVYDLWFNQ